MEQPPSKPSISQSALFAIPESLQNLLGYAAIAYALGFVTIALNTSRYGVAIIELTRPLNLWVGSIPTFATAVAFTIWSKNKASFRESTLSFLVLLANFILVATVVTLLLFGMIALFNHTFGAIFQDLLSKATKHTSSAQAWLRRLQWVRNNQFAISSIGGTLFTLVNVLRTDDSDHSRVFGAQSRNRFLISLVLGFVSVYVLWIYPHLPQQYGFGKPSSVVLILNRESITEQMGILTPSLKSTDKAAATLHVNLIYKTEKEYLVSCDGCDAQVFSLPADSVKAIIWKSKGQF